jgi:hypothetical protein
MTEPRRTRKCPVKTPRIEIFDDEFCSYMDALAFTETVKDMAQRSGAHVYQFLNFTVVADQALSPRQVKHAVCEEEARIAREELKDGVEPGDVWGSHYISAVTVSRIAKEEGITLPPRWFAKAWKAAEQAKAASVN